MGRAKGHGKGSRGKRSKSKTKQKAERAEHEARIKTSWKPETIRVPQAADLLHVRRDGDAAALLIGEKYPTPLGELTRLPDHGSIVLRDPSPPGTSSNDDSDATVPFFGLRLDAILRKDVQARLISLFDDLVALGVPFSGEDSEGQVSDRRSATPAYHFGVWNHYGRAPRLTADTRPGVPHLERAIDAFMLEIKRFVVPLILSLLRLYAPETFARLEIAHRRVRGCLRHQLVRRPSADFGGAFFAVAVKDGHSEGMHVDWSDDPSTPAWIIPLGDWEGAELACPQLGVRIPIRSGQVFGGLMRRLAHASMPITSGRRVVLTCFSDGTLMGKADKYHKNLGRELRKHFDAKLKAAADGWDAEKVFST